ncbi:MAG: F0F1 ATP synthase subunit alpha [Candidatus Omnitrophica bacterium]|nr:F0F1 ATP synthase subunit alpha [Candidatus Omnitrophota bacterium]
MEIKPQEITSIIRGKIENFKGRVDTARVGRVIEVGDGIAQVYGLGQAMMSELVEFPSGIKGMILNLEEETAGISIFGETSGIKEGDEVRLTGEIIKVNVGDQLLGRILNALAEPIDGKGKLDTNKLRPIDVIAPGVVQRQPVKEPLETGIKAIDTMIPIGRGQRELIIGDRQTGKTAIIIDTIINQKGKGVFCVYVAIGQKRSTVARVVETLQKCGAMDYTVVISATASDPTPLQYIAPYTGCAIAEEFRDSGRHALVVYDDLSKHANCYRELSLLLRRPPGREAYPGDIFYTHSRLLERACKLNDELGGGSLTALPIIETQAGDVTTYIPTNVISITDGQIYLESGLFHQGVRPAVNVGLSVSRVGGKAQIKAMRQVAGMLRLDLAQFREMETFAQFGTELDVATQRQIERGRRLVEVLKQDEQRPYPVEEQVAVVFSAIEGLLDDIEVEKVRRFEAEMLDALRSKYSALLKDIKEKKELSGALKDGIKKAVSEFKKGFV